MSGWRHDNAWLATAGATLLNTCTVNRVVYHIGFIVAGRYVIEDASRVGYDTVWTAVHVVAAVSEVLTACVFKVAQGTSLYNLLGNHASFTHEDGNENVLRNIGKYIYISHIRKDVNL